MKKDLAYFVKLRYPIQIRPIPEAKGGGFEASIPHLGKYTFVGDGDTEEEALANLEATKREYFEKFVKEGTSIPEPAQGDDEYSGKILLRIPPYLHMSLVEQAANYGISLNQHLNTLLAIGSPVKEMKSLVEKICDLWRSVVQYELEDKENADISVYQYADKREKLGSVISFPKAG